MVVSGDVIETYTYENPVVTNKTRFPEYSKPVGRSHKANDQEKLKNRAVTLSRAKKKLIRAIHTNSYHWRDTNGQTFLPVFMTLTYSDNMIDVSQGTLEYRKFTQRLNYFIYKEKTSRLKYVAVPEFQERGALHYHTVFFNLPYVPIDDLILIWKHGSVNVSTVNDLDKVANYITKNLKLETDDPRFIGQKRYLASQGLNQPKVTTDKRRIQSVVEHIDSKKTYEIEYANKQYGNIKYERFKR